MPKGKPNPRPEGAPPRVIPHSQSVLYRTIKKALPSGILYDGLVVKPRGLLAMLEKADANGAAVSWQCSDVCGAVLWGDVEGGFKLWPEVDKAVWAYKESAKAKQDAAKFKAKAVQA